MINLPWMRSITIAIDNDLPQSIAMPDSKTHTLVMTLIFG